jgi:hypothetical protein
MNLLILTESLDQVCTVEATNTFESLLVLDTILIGAAEVPLAMVPVAPNPIAHIYARHLYPQGMQGGGA